MPRGGNDEAVGDQSEVSNQAIMNKLLLLLDRLTTNQAAPGNLPSRNTPEQIIESLSATIKEFHHDPAAGMTFARWFSKYEDLFSADGRELDDAAKIRLLLRSLSVPVHEKFLNYLLPRHPRDFTFEESESESEETQIRLRTPAVPVQSTVRLPQDCEERSRRFRNLCWHRQPTSVRTSNSTS